MQLTTRFLGLCLIAILAGAGCGKSKGQSSPAPIEVNGVKLDLPKFQQTFSGSGPELQPQVIQVASDFRYGIYPKKLEDLEKSAANPAATEPQKKIVSDVMEQLKELITKTPGR